MMRERDDLKKGDGAPVRRGRKRQVGAMLPVLVDLYEFLQDNDAGATVLEVGEQLALPRSTAYRYVTQFLPAWLGPESLIKEGPRYRLAASPYRFVRLGAGDQHALAIASRILGIIGMPFQREFETMFTRLCGFDRAQALLTREDLTTRIDSLLAFAEPRMCRPPEDPELVSDLFRFCHRRPRVPIRFEYASATTPDQKERVVWPVGLVFNNAWFLLGYDPAKTPHHRMYAVDRLRRVRESIPTGPDPVGDYGSSEHLRHAWRLIAGEGPPQTVELDMPMRLALETKHPSQRIVSQDGDRATVCFEVAEPLEMTRWVMAHADEVEVLTPEALRLAVRERLQRALAP